MPPRVRVVRDGGERRECTAAWVLSHHRHTCPHASEWRATSDAQLIADTSNDLQEAKIRNPDIKLYGLSWSWPSYLGGVTGNPLDNENTTAYIADWIECAKSGHNLTIDFIG